MISKRLHVLCVNWKSRANCHPSIDPDACREPRLGPTPWIRPSAVRIGGLCPDRGLLQAQSKTNERNERLRAAVHLSRIYAVQPPTPQPSRVILIQSVVLADSVVLVFRDFALLNGQDKEPHFSHFLN